MAWSTVQIKVGRMSFHPATGTEIAKPRMRHKVSGRLKAETSSAIAVSAIEIAAIGVIISIFHSLVK
jgi:hypothetical protein